MCRGADVIRTDRKDKMTWPGIAALVFVALAAGSRVPDDGWNGAAHFALVQSLARLRVAGIREDRPVAKRAGAGFGRALIERDDAALRHHECH
jgi:hypothetical protein